MWIKQFFLVVGLWILMTKPAHAYLDPGSGSYLVQMVIASLVGGGIVIKTFWGKIKGIFARKKNEEKGT